VKGAVVGGIERIPGRLGRILAASCLLVGLGLLGSSCGLADDVSTAITGPLLALKDSDTVVETNLKTILTAVQTGISPSQAGLATTSGPSTSYGLVSVSDPSGGPLVLAGFNQLSDDCLGLVDITTASSAVLGQTQPGTYYFWVISTSPSGCDAASYAATPGAPSGWPAGDPSETGWPLP